MKARFIFSLLVAGLLSALTIPFFDCGGAVSALAQQDPTMNYSGSNVAVPINLQDGTVTDEELFSGSGALGQFTYRELHADKLGSSSTCTTGPYVQLVTGAGVFRFQDGSLMTVQFTQGGICIDNTTGQGHLTEAYQITGGTGNYQGASGTLTLTGVMYPILFDAAGNPSLLTNTGQFQGTVSK